MSVADDDAKDEVRNKLDNCAEENKGLLAKTKDFIYALADFLNNQGEKTDLRMLETYKNTILNTMKNQSI